MPGPGSDRYERERSRFLGAARAAGAKPGTWKSSRGSQDERRARAMDRAKALSLFLSRRHPVTPGPAREGREAREARSFESAAQADQQRRAARAPRTTRAARKTTGRVPMGQPIESTPVGYSGQERKKSTPAQMPSGVSGFSTGQTQTDRDMVPFLGFLSAGATAISGAVNNLFSGEGRQRRQQRRAARRARREARRAARQERRAERYFGKLESLGVEAQGTGDSDRTDDKPMRTGGGFDFDDIGQWLKDNWYVPAGAGGLLLVYLLLKKKKSKVRRRRRSSSKPRRRSSRSTRKRSTRGRKKTQAQIRAERLRNLAKARRAKRRKR